MIEDGSVLHILHSCGYLVVVLEVVCSINCRNSKSRFMRYSIVECLENSALHVHQPRILRYPEKTTFHRHGQLLCLRFLTKLIVQDPSSFEVVCSSCRSLVGSRFDALRFSSQPWFGYSSVCRRKDWQASLGAREV